MRDILWYHFQSPDVSGRLGFKSVPILYILRQEQLAYIGKMKNSNSIPSQRIVKPIVEFAKLESAGGIVLLISTALALIIANTALSKDYFSILSAPFTISLSQYKLTLPLSLWINDGLMAIFFLVVGLEIKREILDGELSSIKQAALPVAAALGGMIIPALIYLTINMGSAGVKGWAIPMATDIAFALGVLTLLGKRVPLALKAFVVALAIVDDIGAVIVIALFYTAKISINALAAGVLIILVLFILNRFKMRRPLIYLALGVFLWLAFLYSGLHPTLAGIVLAILIPAHSTLNTEEYISKKEALLDKLKPSIKRKALSHKEYQKTMQEIDKLDKHFEAPMHRLERMLLPSVTFVIVPVFALANAGVVIKGNVLDSLTSMIALGVMAGLVLGKQIGITVFSWLAIKTKIGSLPKSLSFGQIYGASWLCGIGFTMSLFITNLSFQKEILLTEAKIGILAASIVSGLVGYLLLRFSFLSTKP